MARATLHYDEYPWPHSDIEGHEEPPSVATALNGCLPATGVAVKGCPAAAGELGCLVKLADL